MSLLGFFVFQNLKTLIGLIGLWYFKYFIENPYLDTESQGPGESDDHLVISRIKVCNIWNMDSLSVGIIFHIFKIYKISKILYLIYFIVVRTTTSDATANIQSLILNYIFKSIN